MSIATYRALIDDICKQALIADSRSVYETADIGVNGTNFSISYGGEAAPDVMMIYGDFGELPARVREAVLLRLLESNLFMSGSNQNPSFGYNAETRHVVLVSTFHLQNATAYLVLQALSYFAAIAEEWRNGYFLSADEVKSGAIRSGRTAPAESGRKRFQSPV